MTDLVLVICLEIGTDQDDHCMGDKVMLCHYCSDSIEFSLTLGCNQESAE